MAYKLFLFIQAAENLKAIDPNESVIPMTSPTDKCFYYRNDRTLLWTDLALIDRENDLRVWFQGFPSDLPNMVLRDALETADWERFGTRFIYNKQNGEWRVESDAIGAFSFYALFHEKGVLLSDRLESLLRLNLVGSRENPHWLADILISGFPHDNTCMLAPYERLEANSRITGSGGRVSLINQASLRGQIEPPLSPSEAVYECRSVLESICSEYPARDLGMQLTGGYDSRLLLATFLRLGIKPGSYTFGAGRNYNGRIANHLARNVGLNHTFLELGESFEEGFSDCYEKTLSATDGLASPSHTHYAFVSKSIAGELHRAVSGVAGGELHRGLMEQNVTLPWLLFELLSGGHNGAMPSWFQQVTNSLDEDFKNGIKHRIGALRERWQKESRMEVMLRNVFGGFFQSLMRIENLYLPVDYPFLDPRFLKVVLRSPFGLLYGKNADADALFKIKSQCHLVQGYAPSGKTLMKTGTDKGFPPSYLTNKLLWPLIPVLVLVSRKRRRHPQELRYDQWLMSFLRHNKESILDDAGEFRSLLLPIMNSGIRRESDKFILSRMIHIATARRVMRSKLQRGFK